MVDHSAAPGAVSSVSGHIEWSQREWFPNQNHVIRG